MNDLEMMRAELEAHRKIRELERKIRNVKDQTKDAVAAAKDFESCKRKDIAKLQAQIDSRSFEGELPGMDSETEELDGGCAMSPPSGKAARQ